MAYPLLFAAFMSAAMALTYKNYTITFDSAFGSEFGGDPGSSANYNLPAEGLLYKGFSQGPFDYAAGSCTFVCPQSFPSEAQAAYNTYTTSRYPNSTTLCFNPPDLYFGCNGYPNATIQTNGEIYTGEIAAKGTLILSGYLNKPGPNSVPHVKQSFKYVPQYFDNAELGFVHKRT